MVSRYYARWQNAETISFVIDLLPDAVVRRAWGLMKISLWLCAVITALFVSTGTAHAQLGNRALYFTGEGGYTTNMSGLTTAMTGAGAAGVDTNASTLSGADLSSYRIVFLFVNTGLSAGSISTLTAFYNNGGTIVGVADGKAFRDASGQYNVLTNGLGLGAMFTSTEFDSSCDKFANAVGTHPLNAGATTLRYAYGSDVNGGTLIYQGITMDLVRVNGKFIAIGDLNAVSEDCNASPTNNKTFFANVWTFATPNTLCGNGTIDANEQCDDANGVNTDACTNGCKNAACGDGITRTGVEQCDDGNQTNTDGCLNTCVTATCGDGVVYSGVEQCDDMNQVNTDACLNTCMNATCGDGVIRTGVEQCDDQNNAQTDGCLNTCLTATCGDGFVYAGVEQCDDANQANTDNCLATCVLATCGDGFVKAGIEQCDDANQADTDDCLSTCMNPRCGDGFVHTGIEDCDDGNLLDSDDCLGTCVAAKCGDGVVHDGSEMCDDGNQIDGDTCKNNCSPATCGDGVLAPGTEECDGGGATATCNENCTAAKCGDGIVNAAAGEECEPLDTVECTDKCLIPAPSGGGCCDAGGSTPGQAAVWALLALVALRRRRR